MADCEQMTDRNQVEVAHDSGEWRVTVREGNEEAVMSFEFAEHAESYAAGQRMRLGIARNAG